MEYINDDLEVQQSILELLSKDEIKLLDFMKKGAPIAGIPATKNAINLFIESFINQKIINN